MDCRDPNDIEGDPFRFFDPIRAFIDVVAQTVKFEYIIGEALPESSTTYVYINEQVVDRSGAPNKEYSLADIDTSAQTLKFAVIAVSLGVSSSTYDPLCGNVPDMFPVVKSVVEWQDGFVCPNRDIIDNQGRLNYIPDDQRAIAQTLFIGKVVTLKADRRRKVGDKFVIKPKGPPRPIFVLRDYNYDTQFDQTKKVNFSGRTISCNRYPAIHTASKVKIAEGVFPIEDLS